MTVFRVPLDCPRPDVTAFIAAVTGRAKPDRPPLAEYLVDDVVRRPILAADGRSWVPPGGDFDQQKAYLDNFIEFWRICGYDFVRMEIAMPFPAGARNSLDTAEQADPGAVRSWAETDAGPIVSRSDFRAYPWPEPVDVDFFPLEYICDRLPEGMGFISCHAGGILEHVTKLFGYVGLCTALYDDPQLVQDVVDAVGQRILAYHRRLLDLDPLVAIFQGDDMGFRSGTLISPEHLRRYFLPWHKRFARLAHEAGRPYFLHSCGQLEAIMDDLIDDVGIDAKHSFEDAITPVTEMKRRYGCQIGILGGIDVDVLTRGTPDEVRRVVRATINTCAPGGRYALGSGNSIPSYIPVENYLTMLDEALA
ncbi:MAG: hypothetical protein JXQ73_25925 [Phycisphaerae bacterium]|nr:hypothetical protein [Phycisphaerae bacterium]